MPAIVAIPTVVEDILAQFADLFPNEPSRQLAEAAELLEIELLDHLVICRTRYVSLRERGLGFSS
jgi:RadC-like JAB domain